MEPEAILSNVANQELRPKLLLQMHQLWSTIWNDRNEPIPTEDQSDALWKDWNQNGRPMEEHFHCIHIEDRLIALARTFYREVLMPDKTRLQVLALAGVCSHPDFRNLGLGVKVVRAAFERTQKEPVSCCLFQTGVPGFYKKLGAQEVSNNFVNSHDNEYPTQNPWREPHVMIYPQITDWPNQGKVDLQGKAY